MMSPTTSLAFLLKWDQYACEANELALQLTGEDEIWTDVAKPVQLYLCVNADELESVIGLGFIWKVTKYGNLLDDHLFSYSDPKAESSKDVFTIYLLGKIVEDNLREDMIYDNATSRIKNLFMSYKSLLRRSQLSWVTKNNAKVALYCVLSAFRPESLKKRLDSDLWLSNNELRKDFNKFMKQSIELSVAYHLINNGSPKKPQTSQKRNDGVIRHNKNGNELDREARNKNLDKNSGNDK